MLDRIARRIARGMLPTLERVAYRPFTNEPFTSTPKASRDEYLRLWNDARAKKYPHIDAYEAEHGIAVDPEWFQKLALRTQVVVKKSELCYQHGRLLYTTMADYARKSDAPVINVVETGTARGFSALCMAKALADSAKEGKILTFDVIPSDVTMYWNCIADHEKRHTRRELLREYSDLLDRYVVFHAGDTMLELPKVSVPRVHFAFFDGVHTYDYVMFEFGRVRDRQQPGDVIFFDDYTPSTFPGVVQAVDEITSRHGYSKRVIMAGDARGYVIARKL